MFCGNVFEHMASLRWHIHDAHIAQYGDAPDLVFTFSSAIQHVLMEAQQESSAGLGSRDGPRRTQRKAPAARRRQKRRSKNEEAEGNQGSGEPDADHRGAHQSESEHHAKCSESAVNDHGVDPDKFESQNRGSHEGGREGVCSPSKSQRKTTWDGTTICTHMGTDGGVSFDGLRSGDQADCRAVPKSGNSDYGTSPSPTSLLGRSRSTSSPSCSLQSSRPVLERGHEGGEEVHDHSGTSLPPNISKLDHCSNEVPGQTCGRQADAGTSRTEFSRKTTSRFARMMEFLRLQKWRACSIPCQVESSKCRGQCVFDHHEPHDLHLCKACGKVIDEQQEGHPISDT